MPGKTSDETRAAVGIVIIGRNEGPRLRRCLASVRHGAAAVVYVDSGSSDGSPVLAREAGVEVVELDRSKPYCAARARNAGYARLLALHPELRCVQFIDGDCELRRGWLATAIGLLDARPELAIAAGWLRERAPEASIYNRLADFEWNFSGPGEVDAVGGIFMIRCAAFEDVGGFDETLAAGEEPELCQRLGRLGWRLRRIDREMARHDLAMTRFAQWWTRSTRNGYTSMEGALRFANPDNRRVNWRAWFWAMWLTLALLASGAALATPGAQPAGAALLWLMWPAQFLRIALRTLRQGHGWVVALAHAFFLQIVFLPHLVGQCLYFLDRWRQRAPRLVEYRKSSQALPVEQE